MPDDQRKRKTKNDKYNGLFGDMTSSDDDDDSYQGFEE